MSKKKPDEPASAGTPAMVRAGTNVNELMIDVVALQRYRIEFWVRFESDGVWSVYVDGSEVMFATKVFDYLSDMMGKVKRSWTPRVGRAKKR